MQFLDFLHVTSVQAADRSAPPRQAARTSDDHHSQPESEMFSPRHCPHACFLCGYRFCRVQKQRPSRKTSHSLCPFRVQSIRGPAMMTSVDGPVLMTLSVQSIHGPTMMTSMVRSVLGSGHPRPDHDDFHCLIRSEFVHALRCSECIL